MALALEYAINTAVASRRRVVPRAATDSPCFQHGHTVTKLFYYEMVTLPSPTQFRSCLQVQCQIGDVDPPSNTAVTNEQ
ncbi:hypothetical protein EVAR_81286_1 [Eumeta japonica]|uniref:Uncharacterized protein n=1 Tax=Eumeta variegata TaxID=151549 RepID=A0A4C1VZY1_EUMVA|nr:hypothetical protein EVAR_81286_1 [Eumeta japonica]